MNVMGTSQKITLPNSVEKFQGVPNLWRQGLRRVFTVANN